jgi:probable LLM family oxidoreductase
VQIGIDSFAAVVSDPETGITLEPSQRLNNLLEEIEVADRVGVDSFGVGEHHRQEYLDSAHAVILGAAAARTKQIRLTSAVTVLSANDPVRVFQDFATIDLISRGRAELIVGRGSFTEAFPLFGYAIQDYDSLFQEKLELLLELRANTHVHWRGQHRAPLTGQGIYPRPVQNPFPIWVGIGGTPQSAVRAGVLGLPMMIAIIGGDYRRFRPLADLYREAGRRAGHAPEQLKIGVHAFGLVGETSQQAADDYYPGYKRMLETIGRERGWSPPSRAQFDASLEPTGPYLIGDSRAVAEKVLYVNEVLGGISRLSFQMTNVTLPHAKMLRAIELLGQEVAPLVKSRLERQTH